MTDSVGFHRPLYAQFYFLLTNIGTARWEGLCTSSAYSAPDVSGSYGQQVLTTVNSEVVKPIILGFLQTQNSMKFLSAHRPLPPL